MSMPDFVKRGDTITVKWGNEVVSALRSDKTSEKSDKTRMYKRFFRPLDITSMEIVSTDGYDLTSLKVTIKDAIYIDRDGNEKDITFNGVTIKGATEPFTMEKGKEYYFDYGNGNILPILKTQVVPKQCLKVYSCDWDASTDTGGGKVFARIKNLIGTNIDVSKLDSLSPLFSPKDGSTDVSVIFTKGYLYETQWGAEYDAIKQHEIDINGTSLKDGDSLYLEYTTDTEGLINGSPTPKTGGEPDSYTHWPKCGDDQEGKTGKFQFPLLKYEGGIIDKQFVGCSIEIDQAIPNIDNTMTEAGDGIGRPVKEYKPEDNKFLVRIIKQKDEEPQIHVKEADDTIQIEGNDKDSKLQFSRNGVLESVQFEFKDGLCIEDANEIVQLTHVVAGSGIQVEKLGATYTVSTSGLSSMAISAVSPMVASTTVNNNVTTYALQQMEYDVKALSGSNVTVSKEVSGQMTTFTVGTSSTATSGISSIEGIYPISVDSNTVTSEGETIIICTYTYVADLTSGNGTITGVSEDSRYYQFFLNGILIYTEKIEGPHSSGAPVWPQASNGYSEIADGFWEEVGTEEIKTTYLRFNV